MDRNELAASVLRQAAQQRRRLADEMVADLLREADELDAAADEFDAGVAIEPIASVEWGGDGVSFGLGPEQGDDLIADVAQDVALDREALLQLRGGTGHVAPVRSARRRPASPTRSPVEGVSSAAMPRPQ